MAYVLPVGAMEQALVNSADALIGQLGELMTYQFKDGTASVMIPIYRSKLREEELVGDYKQGDCRFNIRFRDLPKAPAKYDTILRSNGVSYRVMDYLAADKTIADTTTHYVVIGRG